MRMAVDNLWSDPCTDFTDWLISAKTSIIVAESRILGPLEIALLAGRNAGGVLCGGR
jgi:hypothetical protein